MSNCGFKGRIEKCHFKVRFRASAGKSRRKRSVKENGTFVTVMREIIT